MKRLAKWLDKVSTRIYNYWGDCDSDIAGLIILPILLPLWLCVGMVLIVGSLLLSPYYIIKAIRK